MLDKATLLGSNAVTLTIFALACFAAHLNMPKGKYWQHWAIGNLCWAAGLASVLILNQTKLQYGAFIPSTLIVLGVTFHLNAAQEFAGKKPWRFGFVIPAIAMLALGTLATHTGTLDSFRFGATFTLVALEFFIAWIFLTIPDKTLTAQYVLAFAYIFIGTVNLTRLAVALEGMGFPSVPVPMEIFAPISMISSLVFSCLVGAFTMALAFQRTIDEQRQMAHRDPLTGVFNRREFDARLDKLLGRSQGKPFAILQLDIDHFKQVNDKFGHVAGDDVLKACADMVAWHLREEDCLARTGGEEFAVLQPDISREEALATAERIRSSLGDMPFEFGDERHFITLSAGVYHGTGDRLCYKELMSKVDRSLYASKNAGRNRISLAAAA